MQLSRLLQKAAVVRARHAAVGGGGNVLRDEPKQRLRRRLTSNSVFFQ